MSNGWDGNTSGVAGSDAPGGNDRLPWVARFVLFLSILLLAAFMMVLPVWSVQRYGATSGIDLWGPVMATLVGLTTMTISGIFVFMTFRIDRGAKLTAARTADRIAREIVGNIVREVIGKRIAEARHTINKRLGEASKEMEKIKEEVTTTEKRIATAKKQLVERIETLEREMERQFADLKAGMEDCLIKANIDKLIREAVSVHIPSDHETSGGTDESK